MTTMATKLPSSYKVKALMLVTPERANELNIPAEAPVFVSPYVSDEGHCSQCHIRYTPLVYNIGHTTEAQHFCKQGGGLYVRTPEDNTNKWIYSDNLWHATVVARGPIRMGEDKGFTFKTVEPKKFLQPYCNMCTTPLHQGALRHQTHTQYLVPVCMSHESFHQDSIPWSFVWDGTEVRFRRALDRADTDLRGKLIAWPPLAS